jgi:frataxin-like iron-binding protein CyaY
MDTAMAILNNRFQIMAQYRKLVIGPLVKQELEKVDHSVRHQFHRAKRLLSRETSLLDDKHHVRIQNMLEHSQALKVIYEKRLALQQIWVKTSSNGHDMLAAIKDWVHEAEASGIQSLRDFADQLKTYSCARPLPDAIDRCAPPRAHLSELRFKSSLSKTLRHPGGFVVAAFESKRRAFEMCTHGHYKTKKTHPLRNGPRPRKPCWR